MDPKKIGPPPSRLKHNLSMVKHNCTCLEHLYLVKFLKKFAPPWRKLKKPSCKKRPDLKMNTKMVNSLKIPQNDHMELKCSKKL